MVDSSSRVSVSGLRKKQREIETWSGKCKSYTHLQQKLVQTNFVLIYFEIRNLYHVILNFRYIFAKKSDREPEIIGNPSVFFVFCPV